MTSTRAKNKEAKLKLEEEKRIQDLLDKDLADLRKSPLPPPRFTYQVGEEVLSRTGNITNLFIKDILDDGKIFLVESRSSDKTTQGYYSHLSIIPSTLHLAEQMVENRENLISFHNTSIDTLLNSYYKAGIDDSPVYQRDLCWTNKDKENLIHSIFTNVEIGKFVFIENSYEKDGPVFELLDGKQRLNAIIEFYEDKFTYRGKTFSELARKDKWHFTQYNITLGRGSEEMTLEDKMKYFLKMNTSGVPQSEEHLNYIRSMLKK